MNLRQTVSFAVAALAVGIAGPASAAADPADTAGPVTYRCPNNDYKNTISPKEAEKLGCKKLEAAPVTVFQTVKPRAPGSGPVPAAAGSGSIARVDPAAQRARDSDARRILENELKTEEDKLAAMLKEFNNGEPERLGDEKNFQKYLDRVADMRTSIARKQTDIASLKRELQKLPAPRSP